MAARKDKTIDLSLLDAKELSGLRDQLDVEVQSLTQSAVTLQRAAGEFGKSGRAIETLAEQDEGKIAISRPYFSLQGFMNSSQIVHKGEQT